LDNMKRDSCVPRRSTCARSSSDNAQILYRKTVKHKQGVTEKPRNTSVKATRQFQFWGFEFLTRCK
jgi:hypothetical protein